MQCVNSDTSSTHNDIGGGGGSVATVDVAIIENLTAGGAADINNILR